MTGATRIHTRHSVSAVISITNKEQTVPAKTCNVSLGGICADLFQPIASGEDVEIELTLRAGASSEFVFKTSSRVVWCTPIGAAFQCGLKFYTLSDHNLSQLQKFLDYVSGTIK